MDVVAFLPRQLLTQLRIVLGSDHALSIAASWSELRGFVLHQHVDVIVADPSADGTPQVVALEQLRREFPTLPLVVYTTLSPAGVSAIVRLARSGVEHVVLGRFDDDPARFRDLLDRIPGYALGNRFLTAIAEPLGKLPVPVYDAVERLVREPEGFRTAQDLARAAGTNLRTLYRNLETAGLSSARRLLVTARLLRAYAYLQDPGRSIKEVAAICGFHSPWQLAQQTRAATGRTTEQMRREVTGEELITMLVAELRRERRTA